MPTAPAVVVAPLVLSSILRRAAADRILVSDPASVLILEPEAGVQANAIEWTGAVEGQLLWVANDDDDPASLDGSAIGPGHLAQFIQLNGRFRAMNGQLP